MAASLKTAYTCCIQTFDCDPVQILHQPQIQTLNIFASDFTKLMNTQLYHDLKEFH